MNIINNRHEHFMKIALNEAKAAFDEDEIPVGALIVHGNQVISRGYNQSKKLNDSTAHAEMIAITSAQNKIGSRYLNECEMYVTLEPCMMCSGAIYLSKIPKVIYALDDKQKGYLRNSKLEYNKKIDIISNILEEESKELLNTFFFKLRS
ncbi:MAG: tRNA-specific adenosine deaminase [Flammeovirgaceae bacterium]|nr:tRNA-specific adenosine deaminase [Flammeovirgaceae bacterium]|tara:strand:- start:80 stop:529 length:450 start_codon:yes stop_codon:yes gene_type:complete